MSQSTPPLLFSFLFEDAHPSEWERVAQLLTKPAGELTDPEIEQLVALRRLIAKRAVHLPDILSAVLGSLQQLVALVDQVIDQTANRGTDDITQYLMRQLGGRGEAAASPLDLELLRNFTRLVTGGPEPNTEEPLEERTTAAKEGQAARQRQEPQSGLANSILRQSPTSPDETTERPSGRSAPAENVAPVDARALRDFGDLDDMAVWHAISSGAARTIGDLEKLPGLSRPPSSQPRPRRDDQDGADKPAASDRDAAGKKEREDRNARE